MITLIYFNKIFSIYVIDINLQNVFFKFSLIEQIKKEKNNLCYFFFFFLQFQSVRAKIFKIFLRVNYSNFSK